jgi:hypothetical protein
VVSTAVRAMRMAGISAVDGIVAHAQPDGDRQQRGQCCRDAHHRAPAPGFDQHPQRDAGDYPADDTKDQCQSGGQRKLLRCEPVTGQLEHRDEGDGDRGADQQTSAIRPPQIRGAGKQRAADGRDQRTRRQQTARSPPIGDDPGRDLHHHIGVEIEGRKISEFGGPDREVDHQLVGHYRRRDALVETDQIEQGAQPPDTPGEGGGWVAARGGVQGRPWRRCAARAPVVAERSCRSYPCRALGQPDGGGCGAVACLLASSLGLNSPPCARVVYTRGFVATILAAVSGAR